MKAPKLLILGIDGLPAAYVKREIQDGKMPRFRRLMESGVFFEDMHPMFPTISPTCWQSIHTGAVPSVHGALDDLLHDKTADPRDNRTGYAHANVTAEHFWETAAKVGVKTLLVDVIVTGNESGEGITCVLGDIVTTPDKAACDTCRTGVPEQYYRVVPNDAASCGRGFGRDVPKPLNAAQKDGVFVLPVFRDKAGYDADEIGDLFWYVTAADGGVRIGASADEAKAAPVLGLRAWSPVMTRTVTLKDGRQGKLHFRARLEELDGNGGFTVYFTGARNTVLEVQPAEKAQLFADVPEINLPSHASCREDPEKYFTTVRFYEDWKHKVIEAALNDGSYDIVFTYSGMPDTVNHLYAGDLAFGTPGGEAYRRARSAYDEAYAIEDEVLGRLLDRFADEDTAVCVVSDHGTVGVRATYHTFTALREAGLTVYEEGAKMNWRNVGIDWTKTKAYCVGACFVNVNLKGREPCGIVEPEDYDKTVNEIILALRRYTVPGSDAPALAFAMPGDQAGFLGLGGPCCGDVVYGIIGSAVGGYHGGVHAVQIPTARSKEGGDMRPVCIMSGKAFRRGVSLTRPTDLTDIAPTLCYALGLPQPGDATGGVVFAALR